VVGAGMAPPRGSGGRVATPAMVTDNAEAAKRDFSSARGQANALFNAAPIGHDAGVEERTDMPPPPAAPLQGLLDVIAHHWGFRSLRPLQEQAMRAVLEGRDSLVVLPTGGGKSLCYQAPAVFKGGTTVVVSPLISLMKDQVDALQRYGVAAVQIDSSQ